jgi:hypothetical protein
MQSSYDSSVAIDLQGKSLADDPSDFFNYSYTQMHSLSREELEQLQLSALRYRFESLYETIPMVKKLADKQGLTELDTLEDVIPLLFEHTMYKSYPGSLLENHRFDQLTKWLDKLIVEDLSQLDVGNCQGINDWAELLDRETSLNIMHSSGTTGVMSFLPTSKEESRVFSKAWPVCLFQKFGDHCSGMARLPENVEVVSPFYRYGAIGFVRGLQIAIDGLVDGDNSRVHTLYGERLDSDVMYLSGRIQAAKERGNLDSLKVNPTLLQRHQEFEKQQSRLKQDTEDFFEHIINDLNGKRVFMMATWNMIYELAKSGLERGIRNLFAPDSVIYSSGGAKGLDRPENWEQVVCQFAGIKSLTNAYGMTEICGFHIMCEHDHFHIAPWVIPFILDPETSKPLAREGVVTGRAAFYDLIARGHWGGFISGDEVTIHWQGDCPCGAASAYFESAITRLSEKRGGDDKITCAATPGAHRDAMEFLTRVSDSK